MLSNGRVEFKMVVSKWSLLLALSYHCHINLMLSDGGEEMKMGGIKVGLFACFVTAI